MKRIRVRPWMVAMLTGLLFLGIHAYAQEGPPDGGPPGLPPDGFQQPESPTEAASHELKQLSKKLKLTEQQKTDIRPILLNRHERMAALFSDRSGSMEEKRGQIDEIMESSNRSIRDLLRDDQKDEFDKESARMMERRRPPQD